MPGRQGDRLNSDCFEEYLERLLEERDRSGLTDMIHEIEAIVFTANNTPYFANHLEKLPSPTETFVRNYGARLHHIALAVRDGEYSGVIRG